MTKQRVMTAVVAVLVLVGLAACGDGGERLEPSAGPTTTQPASGAGLGDAGGGVRAAPPAGDPSITGTVSSPSTVDATDLAGTILVQDGKDPKGADLAASVRIPKNVAVLREDGQGGWDLASFADLTAGVSVDVWFHGPVAESYPVQATAGAVVIRATAS